MKFMCRQQEMSPIEVFNMAQELAEIWAMQAETLHKLILNASRKPPTHDNIREIARYLESHEEIWVDEPEPDYGEDV